MLKNTADQKWIVFAFDSTTSLPKTGDAAQITANLRKDYGDAGATTDQNPTELEDGFYSFDMAQAETNADYLLLCPASSTENIVVVACPAVIFTEPVGRKYPATLAAADVSGNLPAEVKAQDNIDFGALQKASIKTQAQDGLATVNDVQSGLATPTNITSASGISLSSDGIKAIWDFLTADATAAILSFANLFKTNMDAKVSEAGGGLDAAGVRAAVGLESANLDTQLEAILEDTGTTIPALISAGSGAGVGAISYPYTLTDADDENPISGAEVWVTTDSSGSNIVASGYTNLFGTVIFFLMQEHIIFGVNVQAIILQIRT